MSSASAASVEAEAELASAYVHIPFCARICPYCDFTVVAGRDDVVDRYVAALIRDIESTPPWRALDAVFVGGGTPSRVGPARLSTILEAIEASHGIVEGAEVSLEANPEDLDDETVSELVSVGFTRVSLGVQSFDDLVLKALGRVHTAAQAVAATEAVLSAGFESVSVDLIFGSPAETTESWRASLQTVIDLEPQHVSTYSLTVEPGTVLWKEVRRGAPEPDPDVQADRWEMASDLLGQAGYERYEISNFARPGHHCRYNAAVWAHADYLAFGVGAHGFRGGIRTANVRRLDTYLDRVEQGIGPVQTTDAIEGWALEIERLFVGLRRTNGVQIGVGGEALMASAAGKRLADHGVIARQGDRLVITRPLLTDEVLRTLLALDSPD
jgi:oxygen-independent coproporphyrinogen III oxidase